MTRRRFVQLGAAAGSLAAFGVLESCAPASSQDAQSPTASIAAGKGAHAGSGFAGVSESSSNPSEVQQGRRQGGIPEVYFARAVDPTALAAVFDALGAGMEGSKIGVKLSTGEPGGTHFLDPSLIEGLVSRVGGTIVECNTAYGGRRSTAESHYQVAEEHGFTSIAPFQIMDEDGDYSLPVEGGYHLSENLVGAHFPEYDGMLVLSHFKGHAMAGFGGAVKNISIGLASSTGKSLIHTAGKSRTGWSGTTPEFQESMADAAGAVIRALSGNLLYVNVMNNLSVDCDCDSSPAPPKMADVGILASADPVALDQACVDLIYASDDDSADLIARIESLDGEHTLEACEAAGVGSRAYELVEVSD